MTRHRARPSFTVEIKRTRTGPAPSPDVSEHQRAAQALWKGTALAEVTERADEMFAPLVPARPQAAAPKAPSLERRVLPSLIPAPEPEPIPVPEPVAEPALPRVRRPVLRRPPTRVAVEAEITLPPAEPRFDAAPAPVAEAPSEAGLAPRAPRRPAPRVRENLRPGERWKRRLPRVCW